MLIRRFKSGDEEVVSKIIRRTLIEVNTDCPKWEVDYLYDKYTPQTIVKMAQEGHTYVLEEDGVICGTGSITRTAEKESEILAAFLAPEYIGKGLGRKLFEVLESDELFTTADRVWLTSSMTALNFYEKIGYSYKDGYRQKGEDQLITMEKFPYK